jgi:hypothetical protein
MTANPFADYAESIAPTTPKACPLDLQMMTFFGSSGTGKTSVAAAFPNHVYLDLEASATEHAVNAWPWGKTWAKFKELILLTAANEGGPLDGKTLVIDPVSELWELCLKHELAERKLKEMPDDFGRTLMAIRKEFGVVMSAILKLRMQQRMGCILIAHEMTTEHVTPTARTLVYEPKAGDKWVGAWVAEKAQMILRFGKMDIDPITGKPFSGGPRWIIRTKPLTAADTVKDRTMRLPPFVPATHEALLAAYGDE